MMDIWIFWAVVACLGLAVVASLGRAMLVVRPDEAPGDLRIYRDQLAEVDRDLSRGTLATDEAERLRIEVSRRLLDADRRSRTTTRGTGSVAFGTALILLCLGGALTFYLRVGAPGYPDLPTGPRLAALDQARAARPSQAEAEEAAPAVVRSPDPNLLSLVEQLRAAVDRNLNDLRGQQLLARNEAALGEFARAAAAQQQVIALQDNSSAEDYAHLAELMAYAANGYVSPEAEAALHEALRLDPREPLALYLFGLMMAQGGRADLAVPYWDRALDAAPFDAPWRAAILQAMPQVAQQAGVRWQAPAALPGPSASDVEVMSALPEADRSDAIEGMVASLAGRLDTEGGSAGEWARLINAYAVLGRNADARAAWTKAQAALTGADLDTARAAALKAGVAG